MSIRILPVFFVLVACGRPASQPFTARFADADDAQLLQARRIAFGGPFRDARRLAVDPFCGQTGPFRDCPVTCVDNGQGQCLISGQDSDCFDGEITANFEGQQFDGVKMSHREEFQVVDARLRGWSPL